MPLGSGDHQPSSGSGVSTIIGKMPRRYAATSVPGSRSHPTPSKSSAGHLEGGGNAQRLGPAGCGLTVKRPRDSESRGMWRAKRPAST